MPGICADYQLNQLRQNSRTSSGSLGIPAWRSSVGLAMAKSRPSFIPKSINQLKNERIMSHLLKKIYSIDYNSEVKTLSVREKGSNPGDVTGNLSESGRVVVNITMMTGEKVVKHWFVKIMPKEHKNSDLMNKFNIFENEIRFYQEIAPDLLSFLNDNGSNDIHFDIPKLLFADNTVDGALIILEDVSEQGYSQPRDSQGSRYLTMDKAHIAIEAIARIHAAAKFYNQHNSTKLEEHHSTLKYNNMWKDDEFLERLTSMKDSYCDVLRKSSEHNSGKLLSRFQQVFDSGPRLKEICSERCCPKKTGAEYLQHGDFHYNNLLFREVEGEQTKVMIVDWQLTYSGRSTGDISYLLLSSISPDDHKVNEQLLKEEYFNFFNSYLKEFESSLLETMNDNNTDVFFTFQTDSDSESECGGKVDLEDLDHDYNESAPLSLFLSCGNVLASEADLATSPDLTEDEREQRLANYAYELVNQAADMEII